jgi:hypothetical protein
MYNEVILREQPSGFWPLSEQVLPTSQAVILTSPVTVTQTDPDSNTYSTPPFIGQYLPLTSFNTYAANSIPLNLSLYFQLTYISPSNPFSTYNFTDFDGTPLPEPTSGSYWLISWTDADGNTYLQYSTTLIGTYSSGSIITYSTGFAIDYRPSLIFNPGIYIGNPVIGQQGPFTDNSSVLFDGNSSICTNFDDNQGDFTVECWFYVPLTYSGPSYSRLVDMGDSSKGWWLGQGSTATKFGGNILQNSSPYGLFVDVELGRWNHLVMVRFMDQQLIYVNGTLTATNTGLSITRTEGNNLQIGNDASFSYGFTGKIALAAVYDYALTHSQIFNHYNQIIAKKLRIIPSQAIPAGTTYTKSISDTMALTELYISSKHTPGTHTFTITDSMMLTDVEYKPGGFTVQDSLILADVYLDHFNPRPQIITDTITLVDTVTKVGSHSVTIVDTLNLVETKQTNSNKVYTIVDNLGLYDFIYSSGSDSGGNPLTNCENLTITTDTELG